jgi:hypothetical protein
MFTKEPPSGDFLFIGVPQVNYGSGVISVVGNAILGANGPHDTGLSYRLNGGAGSIVEQQQRSGSARPSIGRSRRQTRRRVLGRSV